MFTRSDLITATDEERDGKYWITGCRLGDEPPTNETGPCWGVLASEPLPGGGNMAKRATTGVVGAVIGLSMLTTLMAGCTTLTGAAVGAGAGAAIGAGVDDRDRGRGAKKGALIGAGVGAAAGTFYHWAR